jgi:hypothetical protein
MVEETSLKYFRDKGLLPFQAEFLREFLSPGSAPFWELASPPGTGKTRLAGELIAHMVSTSGPKRILVLTPRVLVDSWEYRIKAIVPGANVSLVDRKTYLELQSGVSEGESLWNKAAVIVMSIDFAKRQDVVDSIQTVIWDLVVADESHLLVGKRAEPLYALIASKKTRRALLLTSIPSKLSQDLERVFSRRIVKLNDVLDWDERPRFQPPESPPNFLTYTRSKEERSFLQELSKVAGQLVAVSSEGRLEGTKLLRAAASGPFTAEVVLRRLVERWRHITNKLAHGLAVSSEDVEPVRNGGSLEIGEGEEPRPTTPIRPEHFMGLLPRLESLLGQIDEIPLDSKFECLVSYLTDRLRKEGKIRVCIWATSGTTVDYLSSIVKDIEIPVYQLKGRSLAASSSLQAQSYKVRNYRT